MKGTLTIFDTSGKEHTVELDRIAGIRCEVPQKDVMGREQLVESWRMNNVLFAIIKSADRIVNGGETMKVELNIAGRTVRPFFGLNGETLK